MDHLDQPTGPQHPKIEIPILDTEDFQGQECANYPEMNKSWGQRAVFLRDWLLFRLLGIVFGNLFEFKDSFLLKVRCLSAISEA